MGDVVVEVVVDLVVLVGAASVSKDGGRMR